MSRIRIIETTLSVLLLISSVRAAFSTAHCDSYGECVQKNAYGVWCFSTKSTSNYASCSSPWALPLQTHLNQNLSIAYYSPNGQFLGGTDYHVPGTGQTYLCMSARVDPNQNATLCVLASMDNTWYIDKYCFVDVVPSATKDGCFNSGVSGSLVDTTFHYLTSTSSTQPPLSSGIPIQSASSKSPFSFLRKFSLPTPIAQVLQHPRVMR